MNATDSLALAAFAKEGGEGPEKQIVLVLDQDGWHKSARLVIPEGLHLLFLPSHSPELQPAERFWPLSNEPLANRAFPSLDELEQVQAERCRWLQTHPEVVRERRGSWVRAARFASWLAASLAITVMAAQARTTSFSKNCPIRVSKGKPATPGAITKMVNVPANSTRESSAT